MRNRRKLRGSPLLKTSIYDCRKAKTILESNGDYVCCGLHYDKDTFMLSDYDVPAVCKVCPAWHVNWNEKVWNGLHIMKRK